MAQYAINFDGSEGASLQKEISLTGKALAGLEKQTQGLASAISGLFSSFSLDKAMTQAEKTVKRTTTTVRKQTQKALLSFDEIERIGGESTSTTSTTSVTTTSEDATNVNALATAFTTLQTAISGALGAVNSEAAVGELNAIKAAAQGILTLYQAEVENDIPTWLQGLALGTGVAADLIGSAAVVSDKWESITSLVGKIPGIFSGIGSSTSASLAVGIPAAIAGVGVFIAGLYDAIVNGLDWLSGVLIPAGATLAGAGIGAIIGMLGGPIGAGIGALIGLAVGLVTDLVTLIVQNWDAICVFFSNLWSIVSGWAVNAWVDIKNAFAGAGEFFRLLFSTIGTLAKEAFNGISAFLKDVFSKNWSSSLGIVGGMLEGFLANVKNIFLAVKGIFTGVVDFVKNVFSGNWSGAWKSVVSIFKGIWDGIVAVVKAPVNAVIGLINGLVGGVVSGINGVIGALNKISVTIPSWVPLLGGQYFGFNLSTVTAPKIPYLAQGAVLPANKPFMAVVGDQKNGTNVEAPLDTIKQALQEVMQQGNQQIVLNFTGDLAQLGRVLRPVISAENRRVGTSLVRKGAL